MPHAERNEKPLQSWKEIAAYLERDARTAIRWEKRAGLPIRRHGIGKGSSVYAYPSEIDAWRAERSSKKTPPHKRPLMIPVAAVLAGGLMVAFAVWWLGGRVLTPGDLLVEAAQPTSDQAAHKVWDGGEAIGSVSLDGRYASFTDWSTGNLSLHDFETGQDRALTHKESWISSDEFAEWTVLSPDGNWVAYSWHKDKVYGLRVVSTGLEGGKAAPKILLEGGQETPYVVPMTWLPDNERIVCTQWLADGTARLILVSASDGGVTLLRSLGWRDSYHAAASPDGQFLAYDVEQEQGSNVFDIRVIATDGGSDVPLIEHPAFDSVLGWAPDGSGVLFQSDRRGSKDAWFVAAHDGKPDGDPYLMRSGVAGRLGVTQDGSFFYSIKLGGSEIYEASLDPETGRLNSEPRKLALQGLRNFLPKYSPGGKRLAWLHTGQSGGPAQRLVVREERDREREVTLPGEFHHIAWYDDGERVLASGLNQRNRPSAYEIRVSAGGTIEMSELAFDIARRALPTKGGKRVVHQSKKGIFLRDVATGEDTLLTGHAIFTGVRAFDVSPDESQIAYVAAHPEEGLSLEVKTIDGDGPARTVSRLPAGRVEAVVWAPQGDRIFFTRSGPGGRRPGSEWWSVPSQGGRPSSTGLSVEGFTSHSVISFHPDGSRFVYSADWGRNETWVAEHLLPAAAEGRQ